MNVCKFERYISAGEELYYGEYIYLTCPTCGVSVRANGQFPLKENSPWKSK